MPRLRTIVMVLAMAAALASVGAGVAGAATPIRSAVRPAVTTQLQKVDGWIQPGQTLALTALCPAGTAPTAGGVDAPGARMLWSTPSFPHDDGPWGWQAGEVNNRSNLSLRMTVTAVCTGGLSDVSNGSRAFTVTPGSWSGSTAGCPRNLPLLGGGIQFFGTTHTVGSSSPLALAGWSAAGYDDDTQSVSGLAESVCGVGVQNVTVQDGPWVDLAQGRGGIATVTCPNGQKLIGAGFDNAWGTISVQQAHPTNLSTYQVAAQSDRRADSFRAIALCGT